MHSHAAARRTTTWVAILGCCVVASGLPLPLGGMSPSATDPVAARRLAAKDRSRAFPCMDRPCGCGTAEQCFTSCCCNTPAQTLAWARAQGVEVGVLAALERRVAAELLNVSEEGGGKDSCCAATTESCCPRDDAAADREAGKRDREVAVEATDVIPDHPGATAGPETPADREDERGRRPRIVTLRAMLACGGIVAEWFAAGSSLPPPKVEWTCGCGCVGNMLPADRTGTGRRDVPEPPPPRVA